MPSRVLIAALTLICVLAIAPQSVQAQLSAEQRREFVELNRQLDDVSGLLRQKDYDQADSILNKVTSRVDELAKEASLPENDPVLRRIRATITREQTRLERARGNNPGGADGISFVKDVAPIIEQNCLRCHGDNNPRANLQLNTFASWKRGGRTGPLLVIGQANRSLMMARLVAPDPSSRMPRNSEALPQEQIQLIAKWINDGARFDGGSETATLAELRQQMEMETLNITIPKPKGNEKVKFTEDIAPWFANLCLNCHNSRRQSGGLSLETFYDMMKGGDSGEVILPGDMENSRLFRLVGGLELPRMPQGQARITRQNYEDLRQWFREGNTFDGDDPRTPIRSYVRTEAQMEAQRFAEMTPEQMREHRRTRSADQLKRTIPNDQTASLQGDNFLVLGNVPEARLKEVQDWAQSNLSSLARSFNGPDAPWRGGLAVFVMKDRFSYGEFQQVVEGRRAPAEMSGHFRVTPTNEDAYVVLLAESGQPDALKAELMKQMTGAYLQRDGSQLPVWLVSGAGMTSAESMLGGRAALRALEQQAKDSVLTVTQPADIFQDGQFSPTQTSAVGYTLVKYLIDQGGEARFSQLIEAIRGGRNVDQALNQVYGANANAIATGYLTSLRTR